MTSCLRFPFLLLMIGSLFLVSCNAGHDQEKVVDDNRLYLDCQVTGYSDGEEITVRIQMRQGGLEGKAILLGDSASLNFDGTKVLPDSSKMNGAFYETSRNVQDFGDNGGLHELEYREGDRLILQQRFYFPFFSLRTEFNSKVSRSKDLELETWGLQDYDSFPVLHVIMTDTSFYGRGIDWMDTISRGTAVFTPRQLANLKNGPIHLRMVYEYEELLKSRELPGRIYFSYSIDEEFELTD